MNSQTVTQWLRRMHADPEGGFATELRWQAERIREHATTVRMHRRHRTTLNEIADNLDLLVRVADQLDLPDPPEA